MKTLVKIIMLLENILILNLCILLFSMICIILGNILNTVNSFFKRRNIPIISKIARLLDLLCN